MKQVEQVFDYQSLELQTFDFMAFINFLLH